eukprot:GHVU01142842.1.p2 GENE.GHVU01142842.1~~GHVU01142842.1.p2  ORF type:complete len:128 (+),score=7.37 GHVU01142842.1:563-946(+)
MESTGCIEREPPASQPASAAVNQESGGRAGSQSVSRSERLSERAILGGNKSARGSTDRNGRVPRSHKVNGDRKKSKLRCTTDWRVGGGQRETREHVSVCLSVCLLWASGHRGSDSSANPPVSWRAKV